MNSPTINTTQYPAATPDIAVFLLRNLIDYAGLFPPASLPIAECVANFDKYSRSEWNWILGRLIVPAARLGEFEEVFIRLSKAYTHPQIWRLSVLLGSDVQADIAHANDFNARFSDPSSDMSAVIESVELKIDSAAEVDRLAAIIPTNFATYFEVLLSACKDCISAIANCGRRAKLRTGGETPDKIPPAAGVIEFIRLCHAANVPFKATAGLHHPIHSMHRLTYKPDSPSGVMHGFLNVFLAAAFLKAGMEARQAVQLLSEQSPQEFRFDADQVIWREHPLNRNQIASTRQDFAISFGSCSFTEPVDDLRALGML